MKQVPLGTYQHYKGKKYEVIGNALHTETREWVVIYRALYPTPELPEGTFFVRPIEMFTETVNVNEETVPRFQLIL